MAQKIETRGIKRHKYRKMSINIESIQNWLSEHYPDLLDVIHVEVGQTTIKITFIDYSVVINSNEFKLANINSNRLLEELHICSPPLTLAEQMITAAEILKFREILDYKESSLWRRLFPWWYTDNHVGVVAREIRRLKEARQALRILPLPIANDISANLQSDI